MHLLQVWLESTLGNILVVVGDFSAITGTERVGYEMCTKGFICQGRHGVETAKGMTMRFMAEANRRILQRVSQYEKVTCMETRPW